MDPVSNILPFQELRHIAPATGPESWLASIDRAATEYPPFKGRILGCRVLLLRIEENITHSGRFLLPDTYQHGSVMYRVLAVGPGEWVKIGKKQVFVKPEVQLRRLRRVPAFSSRPKKIRGAGLGIDPNTSTIATGRGASLWTLGSVR